jgi:hypothetical protein
MDPRRTRPRYRFPAAGPHRGGRYHRDHVSQGNAIAGEIIMKFNPRDLDLLEPIGFWGSSPDPDPTEQYPWPQAREHGDEDENFIAAYCLGIYPPVATGMQYRGWSCCRLCGQPNGSNELHDDRYYWPAGLAHYVRAHHVQLPHAFRYHAHLVATGPARPALTRCAPLFPAG